MSEITKTQLFKIKDNKIVEETKIEDDFNEKKVQSFYENNLEELLSGTFIASEFAFDGGRIDTFGIDEDYRPMIIEYKKSTSDSVLLQALFYKNFIVNNWEKAYKKVLDVKGQDFADKINWRNIRVIIVAQLFDKWTIASTTFLEGVELYSFRFYKDSFFQEFLNQPSTSPKKIEKLLYKQGGNEDYPSTSEADFSVDQKVLAKSGKVYPTNAGRLAGASEEIKQIAAELIEWIEVEFENTEIVYRQDYWAFKSKKKFVEFIFYKNSIDIQVVSDGKNKNLEDMNGTGHWGSLRYLYKINSISKIEMIKDMIKESAELVSRM